MPASDARAIFERLAGQAGIHTNSGDMAISTHKSSLWKVLGLYGAGSWVVLQVVDVLAQNAGLPGWVFTLALILLIIGLPVVGATAYLHGLGRRLDSESSESAVRDTPSAPRQLFTWRNAIAGGVGDAWAGAYDDRLATVSPDIFYFVPGAAGAVQLTTNSDKDYDPSWGGGN